MRAKIAAAFVFGFATGVLCLGVALWHAGNLKTAAALSYYETTAAAAPPAPTPDWQKPMVPLPVDVNALAAEAKKMPPPGVDTTPRPLPVPVEAPKTPPAAVKPGHAPVPKSGDADRTATPDLPPGPHLGMPLAGIDAKKLLGDFEDRRDGRRHEALDIMSPRNTPVIAVAEGNVAKLFTSKDGGLTVYQFDNTRTWCYYYAHLDHYAEGLVEGTLLRKGQVLGYVGSTGNASKQSPHLHFAVFRLNADKKWWQGTPIDPLPLLR